MSELAFGAYFFDGKAIGKNDAVSYMDGTRILRVELDLTGNGKVDRWDLYGPDGSAHVYKEADTLSGEDVLPGFAVLVRQLFW